MYKREISPGFGGSQRLQKYKKYLRSGTEVCVCVCVCVFAGSPPPQTVQCGLSMFSGHRMLSVCCDGIIWYCCLLLERHLGEKKQKGKMEQVFSSPACTQG